MNGHWKSDHSKDPFMRKNILFLCRRLVALVCSSDFPMAHFWAMSRILRLADGPDEVHRRAVARMEIRKHDMKE